MTARDVLYGRRGGRWASPDAGRHRQAITDAFTTGDEGRQRVELSAEVLFHPKTIATSRAHQRDCTHRRDEDCPAVPDPDDLAELWAGRARMARARQAAGRPLTDLDRQGLALHPTGDDAI